MNSTVMFASGVILGVAVYLIVKVAIWVLKEDNDIPKEEKDA